MRYRLGIDIGGINTDAVILNEENKVIAKGKTAVTRDVITGITRVVQTVLDEAHIEQRFVEYYRKYGVVQEKEKYIG